MIERYKTVSIVYGGSGGDYARTLNKMINDYEKENRYPITSRIVMESILTKDILDEVSKLFRETEICIAILTAEDCCIKGEDQVYRLRQNVVFELGMAFFHLGRERCILLGDFGDKLSQVEIPSDMSSLDIRFFNQETQMQVFEEVLKKVLQLSRVPSLQSEAKKEVPQYDNLLCRSRYYVDYGELFRRYDKKIGLKNKDYLQNLLADWLAECKSLKYFDERLMYVFERIAFLPIFGKQKALENFYVSVEEIVGDYGERDIDYYQNAALLKYAKNVFTVVNNYIKYKMVDGWNPGLDDYEELLFNLKLNPPPKGVQINPLVEVLYYDYMGLIHMHIYSHTHAAENLAEAKFCYEKIINEYLDKLDLGLSVWAGFLYYNLARLYGKIWQLNPSQISQDDVLNTFFRATSIRKKWLTVGGFNSMIKNALSYEYFIAKIDYIQQMKAFGTKSKEDISSEYQKVEGEIESYCNDDERLERLMYVQEKLRKCRLEE